MPRCGRVRSQRGVRSGASIHTWPPAPDGRETAAVVGAAGVGQGVGRLPAGLHFAGAVEEVEVVFGVPDEEPAAFAGQRQAARRRGEFSGPEHLHGET